MTKSEFLAQENVPEFIKAVVSSLPSDVNVEIEGFKLGKPQKKESCSCDRVHEDGVDICGRYWRPRGSTDRAFRLQWSYLKI